MKTVIGLTGGTGAGKTSFAAGLAEEGALIIDADQIGRALLTDNIAVRERLRLEFGDKIFSPGGEVSRSCLAGIVFNDYNELKKLNSLVHPYLIRRIHHDLIQFHNSAGNVSLCVIDMALLFELYMHPYCDSVIFVRAPAAERIDWLKEERGWDASQTKRRIGSQMADEEKAEAADKIILNDSTLNDLRNKAVKLFREYSSPR